ncbi:MAG: site-specific DNA-methyltransferase [Bryobacteraceae bacterium]
MATKAKHSKKAQTDVDSIRHKDKRANIPTEELRDFVADEEKLPKTMLYPRDPSLDPQLVWKGKDEQDAQDLAVPVVPVYIQEKIHPQALIEDLRAQTAKDAPDPQAKLFADFNGIEFEQYIDFYHHGQSWTNRMVLGDSLLVMASLAEKEGLKGKVQMIYMDPPYGIRFGSNWQVSTRKRDVKDGKAEDLTRQPEQIRAFRDTWEVGIHSYLAYLRDRLVVSRDLLTETGSVFVQIGDENVHLVRAILDEVFGTENFVSQVNVRSMTALGQDGMANVYDYVLWYAKGKSSLKYYPVFQARDITAEPEFGYLQLPDGGYIRLEESQIRDLSLAERSRVFKRSELRSSGYTQTCTYSFRLNGVDYAASANKSWRTNASGMQRLIAASRILVLGNNPYFRQFHADFPVMQLENSWHDTAAGFSETKIYVVQTNNKIIERCLLMCTDPGDLVLDPTCGSGTTAHVAEQWGRRWITCDTSRVALALARTRLMAAKYLYYVLADSAEGIAKEAEITGVPPSLVTQPKNDIKRGFVYKRVPHVTLKSIANNDEIDAIHASHQEELELLRAQLNAALKQKWQEWEIPREADPAWPKAARAAHEKWWALRRERQQQIDASIARRAETEYLYDQPYEDGKRIRVSGPFTVESLSPHRVLTPENEDRPATERAGERQDSGGDFVTVILDNLRKAGIKGTEKGQAIKFDHLEPYPGGALHAEGEYTTPAGKRRRVAVAIGPQYGTVGPDDVKEAAKEAVQGVGHDLLVVCGFAFDPHVSEEVKRYGKLVVQAVRMNSDLLMGEELLKKTGAGNLFMVFGEPDVDIRKRKDGKLEVEIRGVDVYDPTTQEIRSHSTGDIACWFIDTAYNGESFFVRHAYFTGADDPYDKLKRALRAEVDEAAWASLCSTTSRPFERPKTGKIAVKVINHYGDEVLKVFRTE